MNLVVKQVVLPFLSIQLAVFAVVALLAIWS